MPNKTEKVKVITSREQELGLGQGCGRSMEKIEGKKDRKQRGTEK